MAARTARPPRRRSRARRSAVWRRRLGGVLAMLALLGLVVAALAPQVRDVAEEIVLPLEHEDVIREQAREKDLDPALVAAVIFVESRFDADATSSAGARGLMQVTPDTARGIAQRSGGTAFVESDLADPKINVSYGSFYLRTLLDRYDGDELTALAAYNAGQGNVAKWGELDEPSDIPFAETRAYAEKVREAKADYRRQYAAELGL